MATKVNLTNMRSGEALTSFVIFCIRNPEYRFWQALRNWSGHNFILFSRVPQVDQQDTFYLEGLDGLERTES